MAPFPEGTRKYFTSKYSRNVQTICFDIIQGNLSLIRFPVKPHVLEFTKDLN